MGPEIVKFATRNYSGEKVDCYLVEERDPPKAEPKAEVGHLVLVLDRSGSMYGDRIEEAKWAIQRVITLQGFLHEQTRISFYGYSSDGDVTEYWHDWPANDILLPHASTIQSIQAGGLTCVTQVLDEVMQGVGDETTAIVLHSDGWFNDPSPTAERRGIRNWIESVRPRKNVMVNTIAYGDADFGILSEMANALSGRCVQTTDSKVLYEVMHDTAKLISGRVCPVIELTDEDDYKTAVNITQRRVNGSATALFIRGVAPDDSLRTYHYRKVTAEEYDASEAHEVFGHPAVYAFARAKLAEGSLNAAKYALIATRDRALIEAHAKALTSTQLLALAQDLEGRLYDVQASDFQDRYGVLDSRMAITEIAALLQANKNAYRVHLHRFLPTYKRRGLRRLQGHWGMDGFVPAPYIATARHIHDALEATFEYNNENATLNMTVSIPAVLMDRETEEEIDSVAGHSLDRFSLYRSYTLVGDGNVNVDVLPITINDKRLHAALVAGGALPDEPYNHKQLYEIKLHSHPLVPFRPIAAPSSADIVRLAYLRAIRSVFEALVDDKAVASVAWTDEQLAELKAHHLTRTLGFNPPTVLPYQQMADALATGLADSRVSYEVIVGLGDKEDPTRALPVLSDMPSANEVFGRYFTATRERPDTAPVEGVEFDAAGKVKKAKLSLLRKGFAGESKAPKALARLKRQPFDDIFNDVLTLFVENRAPSPAWQRQLAVGEALEAAGVTVTRDLFDLKAPDFDVRLAEATAAVEREIERMYDEKIRPLVFFIGSSGLVPDEWKGATMLTEEEVSSVAPGVSGGNFVWFEDRGLLVTIRTKVAYYSTEEGLAAAKALQAPEYV
jgi:hypothetical protein